jgi:exopolyphosphatase/guanosine-5'-triphosphate,3'-diphosphate pyrophosphatase
VNRAVISLGTNTARLLVARDEADGRIVQLEHRQIGTRLGEGLHEDGTLAPQAVERTLAAVMEFVAVARERHASLASIATSAVRRASDARAFAARMASLTGVPLQILAGRREAEASFRGATYELPHDGSRIAVVDVGGGSTECAIGRDGRLDAARSIEIGSVRVAECFPELMGTAPVALARAAADGARAAIAEALAPLGALPPVERVRCVAGTPMTVAAVLAASHVDRVSGTTLSRADLDATIARLLELTLAERRALPGMLAQRADILPAGGLILSEALRLLGAESGVLEANDLLLGFLLMEGDAAKA